MLKILAGFIAIVLGFGAASTFAASGPPSHVQARMVADVSAVTAGTPFTIGIELTVDPGWHVYWKNPGDSGQAPKVKLILPEGFTAGELQFPVPTELDQNGGLVVYGYENQVLLTVVVTPPKELPKDFSGTFGAAVSWLVCQDVCIPGKEKLDMILPSSEDLVANNETLFAKWLAQLPVAASASPDAASVKTDGKLAGDQDAASSVFTTEVKWKNAAPKEIQFFPGSLDTYNIKAVKVVSNGDVTRIEFTVQRLAGQKPKPETLDAVVGYTDKDGNRRGFVTTIHLPDNN